MCEGFLSQDNTISKWGMLKLPFLEELSQIMNSSPCKHRSKKNLDAQPKYLSLRLDHAFSFFPCVFVNLRKGPANASC